MKHKKNPRLIYKIVLAGDGGVGKTTLLRSKLAKRFIPVEKITIGIDFDCYQITNYVDEDVDLLCYDLGAQKRFHFIHSIFIPGSKAAVVIYDLTRPETVDNLPYWINLVQTEYESIPIVLAGSKRDLVDRKTMNAVNEKIGAILSILPSYTNIVDHVMYSAHSLGECNQVFMEVQKLAVTWKNQMLAPSIGSIDRLQPTSS
ncbi:MAG: hypothetical protein DRO88_10220 [Promethearchaeia archaeon]|nr:MAG: hypothetical protein DRO88_10220 [Candidatus Lokiarchaeia archaeon]